MSDQPKHPDPVIHYSVNHLHLLLDKAGAVQADANGLFTVEQRIARLGSDNLNHVRECRQWRAAFDVPSPALVNLPRTGDGRKIVPGMTVWWKDEPGELKPRPVIWVGAKVAGMFVVKLSEGADEVVFAGDATSDMFSSRDAAEKARAGK